MIIYVLLFDKEPPGLGILALAGVIFAVTLWVLNLSRRLILGRPYPGGGLFSPFELRVFACSWIALPLMSLLTGSWQKPGSPLALQLGTFLVRFAVAVLIAFALFEIASSRKARSRKIDMERYTSMEPPA